MELKFDRMAEIIPNGAGRAPTPEKLWEHADPESTPMWKFLQKLNAKYSLDLQTYEELHTWSCENLAEFWEEVWIETGVKASKSYEKVHDCSVFSLHSLWRAWGMRIGESLM